MPGIVLSALYLSNPVREEPSSSPFTVRKLRPREGKQFAGGFPAGTCRNSVLSQAKF